MNSTLRDFFSIFFLFEMFEMFLPKQHLIKILLNVFFSVRKAFIFMVTKSMPWLRFISQTFYFILIYLDGNIATEPKCLYTTVSMQVWWDIIGSFYHSGLPGLILGINWYELLITDFTFYFLLSPFRNQSINICNR